MIRTIRVLAAGLMIVGASAQSFGQVITDTSDTPATITLPFGLMTPGTSNNPDSFTVQFRIRNRNAAGYSLKLVSTTFTPTPFASADGGSTIAASDIGVGIVSVNPSPAFNGVMPRSDVITGGFDYDPASVAGTNGLTPFGGLSGSPARATVQDLISTPNIRILGGNQIHSTDSVSLSTNYLTVTMRFAVVRQYFTPATFSGTITVQLFDGP